MFRRVEVVQNDIVARQMRQFFRKQGGFKYWPVEDVARTYAKHLWRGGSNSLLKEKKDSRSRFYVGLATGDPGSLEELTKRATLVSDTLLLTHNWIGECITVEDYQDVPRSLTLVSRVPQPISNWDHVRLGMYCPDLAEVGRWIMAAEPLLKAGLAWYLPCYATDARQTRGRMLRAGEPEHVRATDFLVRDGRAIDASGVEPIKSRIVRPVLHADLPYIAGVSLRDFSEITIEEFASYSAFRDFLRQTLLDMDESLNAVQSDLELAKLGLQIKDEVRSIRSEMGKTKTKSLVTASGGAIASVSAVLVAVYGPALEAAITAIGATGGVWGIIHAAAEHRTHTRSLRENKWYYVWALAQNTGRHVI